MKKFLAVLSARNKEFLRDRASLAWNILFPLFIVLGFSIAFSGKPQDLFKVAVDKKDSVSESAIVQNFLMTQYIQFVDTDDVSLALEKLKHHQFDMVLSFGKGKSQQPSSPQYWINSTSPKGYIVEKILLGTSPNLSDTGSKVTRGTVEGREIRYVDWLISGLLGMNIMFSALFGVGYVIVRYRKNGVLRRFKATPLSAIEFISAQVVSRFILILCVGSLVYFGCNLFLKFQMLGSYFNLFLVFGLGALCLISLGLLVASRIQSEELANGVLNMLTWPMMFFSGVWFSLDGTNPYIQKLAYIFPLTHVTQAARAVMLDGASLTAILPNLAVLGSMTVVFVIAGSYLFRWD